MRYRTQAVAYPYFVVALLLYGLQMAFGLLSVAKYLGPDPIKAWLPFDVTKAIHTNLLIVWVLTGFMGAAYWLVPEESRTELHSPRLAYFALALWTLAGVTAIVGYLFRWTAGNKLLEQPLPVKLAIVVVMLMFLYNLGMTIWKAKRLTTTEGVLMAGLVHDGNPVSAVAVRVRQLHGRDLLPLVDRPSLGRGSLGDDPGGVAGLSADPAVGRRSRGDGEVALRDRGADVHLRPARHRAPLLFRRRAAVLAADRRLLLGARAARVPGDVGLRVLRRSAGRDLSHPEHARVALDARQRPLLRARCRAARPRAHLAVGQQVDARHADHADARPLGVLRRVRDDRARRDHLCAAGDDRDTRRRSGNRRSDSGPSGCRSAACSA